MAARAGVAMAYMIFDIVELDGRSLFGLPYAQRREMLEDLPLDAEHRHVPPFTRGGGPEMLQISREQGLDGIIAKRLRSRYEPGKRTGAWLKIKNQARQEFVIGGWVPGAGKRAGRIGAVVVGYWEGDALVSAGKVGTGFTDRVLADLAERLGRIERATSPFGRGEVPRETRFAEPELVCAVDFTEWTSRTGQLRHPSFKGLRFDKPAREVVREG